MKSILLSYPIGNNTPYYIGTTEPSVKPNTQIKDGDDYNTYTVKVGNHCGTHVDAPKHFIDNGRPILDYGIDELTMNRTVIIPFDAEPYSLIKIDDFSHVDLSNFDVILFKTGFERFRTENLDLYLTDYPGVSPDSVQWIRENHPNIRCIGIDTISMSRYDDAELAKQTHINAFKEDDHLGDPILFIEDMKLADTGDSLELAQMLIVPWQIKGIDSAPCTVIGFLNK